MLPNSTPSTRLELEHFFIETCAGEAGERNLQEQFMALLPTEGKATNLSECAQSSQTLLKSS